MTIMIRRSLLLVLALVLVSLYSFVSIAQADTSASSHYQLTEPIIGGSGVTNSQSANYQSSQSSGVLGIGNSLGSSFQINNGHETTNDPALGFAITTPTASFGNFSAGNTATATANFEVADYTSYGYVVQIVGNTPTDPVSNHAIAAMATTGPSQAGIEQFGINLVANTSPVSLGANPDHGQFGFGSASSNYGTADNYRYVSGETIASAPKSSGQTIYTISYIINVSSLTVAGQYSANQTIVCTGTY